MTWLISNGLMRLPKRWFHTSSFNLEQNLSKSDENGIKVQSLNTIPVRTVDKRFLVWSGKYKKMSDVPDRLSHATIASSHSICRVKLCNYMIICTILASIIFIYIGKNSKLSRIEMSRQRSVEDVRKLEKEEEINSLKKS